MYNWSTDTARLKKTSQLFEKWKLEQMINFGAGNEKIDKKLLKKHFLVLDIDARKKEYLHFLLWPNRI